MKSTLKSVLFCIAFTILFIAASFLKNLIPAEYERWAHGIIGTLVAFIVTFIFLKIDKRTWSQVNLVPDNKTILKFLSGIIIGIVLMAPLALLSIHYSGASIEFNSASGLVSFLLSTAALIPLAFMEELGFRAYPLETIKEKSGIRISLLITAVLFALYHFANGWSITSSFMGPFVWGLIFGLGAVAGRGIALSTGIHYAANLTTAAFGMAGSTSSLFILKENETMQVSGNHLQLFISAGLFVLAAILIELYIKRNNADKRYA
ncbi:MAG: CPBP family intramembrane metalloprotease [Sphingobacteriales bacterium]|nr:CPBP family intramembrane metalloprotease [Sphingobacteriales bacterium]MBI3719235.1 CPBP family intramembrane metalloprotease [Sphingobacteriales bacterium]